MPHQVHIINTQEDFICHGNESLLEGMMRLCRKGIPVGCRGGACGVCKIKVVKGTYHAKRMSCCHVSKEEQANNIVLACRIYPQSDITLEVIGKCQRQFENKYKSTQQVKSLAQACG